jgi:hypothetical protein
VITICCLTCSLQSNVLQPVAGYRLLIVIQTIVRVQGARAKSHPLSGAQRVPAGRIAVHTEAGAIAVSPRLVGTASANIHRRLIEMRHNLRSHTNLVGEAREAKPTAEAVSLAIVAWFVKVGCRSVGVVADGGNLLNHRQGGQYSRPALCHCVLSGQKLIGKREDIRMEIYRPTWFVLRSYDADVGGWREDPMLAVATSNTNTWYQDQRPLGMLMTKMSAIFERRPWFTIRPRIVGRCQSRRVHRLPRMRSHGSRTRSAQPETSNKSSPKLGGESTLVRVSTYICTQIFPSSLSDDLDCFSSSSASLHLYAEAVPECG